MGEGDDLLQARLAAYRERIRRGELAGLVAAAEQSRRRRRRLALVSVAVAPDRQIAGPFRGTRAV